jgi:26S proteasome regulatory subunit N6
MTPVAAVVYVRHVNGVRQAALTASRSNANTIYVPPKTQARIDAMSGTLSAEERDYTTAYSYYFEAFESFAGMDYCEDEAVSTLKLMLLSKVMNGQSGDVQAIANGKQGMKFAGVDVQSMVEIGKAAENRSLHDFEATLKKYPTQLGENLLVKNHLERLYKQLMEKNLTKICEPYSTIEIQRVADLIKLPLEDVEIK